MWRRCFPFTHPRPPAPSSTHTFQGGGSLVSGLFLGSRWGCMVTSGPFSLLASRTRVGTQGQNCSSFLFSGGPGSVQTPPLSWKMGGLGLPCLESLPVHSSWAPR